MITIAMEGGMEVWDAATGELVRSLEFEPTSGYYATWSADRKLFATESDENVISIWDAQRYEVTGTLQISATGSISSMVWSPDNTKIYIGLATDFPCRENCDYNDPEYKGWITSWSVKRGYLASKTSVADIIKFMAVSPDGKWLAAGGGLKGSFILLDGSNGAMEARLSDTHAQDGVAWLDNNHVLYLPNPSHIDAMSLSEWDVAWGNHSEILLPGFETISSIAWLPNGKSLFTNSAGGTLSIWQVSTGERLDQFQLLAGSLPVSKFNPSWISPVEPLLAVGAENSLALVDLEKRQVERWLDHKDIGSEIYIVRLEWSRDGQKMVVTVGDRLHPGSLTTIIWDIQANKRLLTIPEGYSQQIKAISLSPDGRQLAMSRTVRGAEQQEQLAIWDIAAGKEVQSITLDCPILDVQWFAIDRIEFECCASPWIWDLVEQRQYEISGLSGDPAISPDGRLAASICLNVGITLWDIQSSSELATLEAKHERFGYQSFAFSPDGMTLASLTDNGSLLLWDVSKFSSP